MSMSQRELTLHSCEARVSPCCRKDRVHREDGRIIPNPLHPERPALACSACFAVIEGYRDASRLVHEYRAPQTDRRISCCIPECEERRLPGEIYCAAHDAESREEERGQARARSLMGWCVLAFATVCLAIALFAGCRIP
jgi:hypothetical protein